MSITAFFEIHVTPEALEQGVEAELHTVLTDTRAFDGCLGVEVLVDAKDPTHFIAVERWESAEHDAAYRAWRAGDGAADLRRFLAAAPTLRTFQPAEHI